jgi:predicted amidohydrolase
MPNGYNPRVRIALAQLDAVLGDVEANLERARAAIAEATASGADLVVFPELYLSGYALRGVAEDTARVAADVAAHLRGPALVGFHEADGESRHNSAAYVAVGAVVHTQRKLYLVDYEPFGEDELFAPGSELRAFDTPLGRFATLICNDAWQPFLPFVATQDGADVLFVPSCSSTVVPEAEAYWYELTRFHARMLQCFVVFVNRVGSEGGFTFWGGSHVVAPDGKALAEAPRSEEAIVYADLDLEQVHERRRRLTIVGDPRLDLVRAELERLVRNRGHTAR